MFSNTKTGRFAAIMMGLMIAVGVTERASAQHSDIEFGYDGGKIEVEFGSEGPIFESEFPTSGIFEQNTDDPGLATNEAEGLVVGAGDSIDYNILGPLMYHNGTGFAPVPAGAGIIIGDNPSGTIRIDGSTVGPVSGPGLISIADVDGDVHSHIDFTLDPPSLGAGEYGSYALKMELTTDGTGVGNSDPFFIVFNFGLDEGTFEETVEAFAAAIPEPGTMVLSALGGLVLMARRRRVAEAV